MKQFSKSVVTSGPYSPFDRFNRQLVWRCRNIGSGFLQDIQRGAQVIQSSIAEGDRFCGDHSGTDVAARLRSGPA
jgi:hypothetical protein